MPLIMHIGHGKTGTSAIQSWLANNRDLLREADIEYPADLSDKNAMAGLISSGNRKTFNAMDSFKDSRFLFSNENFFHQIANEAEDNKFYQHADEIEKVILFTRNLFDMLTSSWGQSIKRGGKTADINEFAAKYNFYRTLNFRIQMLKSKGIPVEVRNYSAHSKNIVPAFLSTLLGNEELAAEIYAKSVVVDKTVNRSLTMAEYELQRLFNKFYKGASASFISDPLVNTLPHLRAESPKISSDVVEGVVKRNSEAIAQINLLLPPTEQISVEYNDDIRVEASDSFTFTNEQLEVFAKQISRSMHARENQKLPSHELQTLKNLSVYVREGRRVPPAHIEKLNKIIERVQNRIEAPEATHPLRTLGSKLKSKFTFKS